MRAFISIVLFFAHVLLFLQATSFGVNFSRLFNGIEFSIMGAYVNDPISDSR